MPHAAIAPMAMLHIDIPVRVGTPKQLRSPGVGGWGEQDACKPQSRTVFRLQYTKPHTAPLVCQKEGGEKGTVPCSGGTPSRQGVMGRVATEFVQLYPPVARPSQSTYGHTVAERGWRHVWMITQRDAPHRFISSILASDRRRLSARRTSGSQ